MNCVDLPGILVNCIHETNNHIIKHMIDASVDPMDVCIHNQITFDKYFSLLDKAWSDIFNNISNKSTCKSLLSMIKANPTVAMSTLKKITNKETLSELVNENPSEYIDQIKSFISSVNTDENIDKFISDYVIPRYITKQNVTFKMDKDGIKTMKLAGNILFDHCICQFHAIFDRMMSLYSVRLRKIPAHELKDEIKRYYNEAKSVMQTFMANNLGEQTGGNNTNPTNSLIGEELNRLIPDSLGSLKKFFITVISTYYSELHPIIWGQILLKSYDNFTDIDGTPGALPMTKDELFQFASRQMLLNSGPFILKTLQMIRPVLTPELATKYNLTSLKYPLLKGDQIEMILRGVTNYDMFTITRNVSASVGHVCVAFDNKDKSRVFVVKIIKPVSIAQSCWEYKTLVNVFPSGCERDFVVNMLKSNGREMNVLNELENIKKGAMYSANYSSVFGSSINAKLDAIKEYKDPNGNTVVKPGSWFAMAMTLAPGLPVSSMVEKDLLKEDTKYRAVLHRCLDLLVYKFFHNIVQAGFYHGDLHAGNMFYSYKEKAITLIDFGAVGELNLIKSEDQETTNAFIKIIIMSIFYNYDGILDYLTDLLNNKCKSEDTMISKNTEGYNNLKAELIDWKHKNIMYSDEEKKISAESIEKLFSSARINAEQHEEVDDQNMLAKESQLVHDSIYSYLEMKDKPMETVVENADRLPVNIEVLGNKQTISFVGVLEKILAFYALNGVNIAIKFSDFYEFQKAYLLLLGVLHKVGYSSYRIGMAIKAGIANVGNLFTLIQNPKLLWFIIKTYRQEQGLYGKEDTRNIKEDVTKLGDQKDKKIEELQNELQKLSEQIKILVSKK